MPDPLSTDEQIRNHYIGGIEAWKRMTPDQQRVYIESTRNTEKKNKQWLKEHGINSTNSTKKEEGGSQGTATQLPDRIQNRAGQFAKILQEKSFPQLKQEDLKRSILEKYILTSGESDEDRLQKARNFVREQITANSSPTMSGGRRRNRTKHRRSKNKRTRRFRRR